MIFIALLILASAALASAAGFFSIYGLSQIYAASALSVIIMGSSLEFAKLITASFLYRFWEKIGLLLKIYLLTAVGILMLTTSIGIFGYLTAAYQQDNIPITQITQTLTNNKLDLQLTIDRKKQIDQQIANLPNNYVNARKQLINSFASEYKSLQPKIDRLTQEISVLQDKLVTTEAQVGPIMYVAKVLNQNPDNSIFYLTIIIVIVFDPLAVALTISVNLALADYKNKKNQVKIKQIDDISISKELTPEPYRISKKDEILNKIRKDISSSNAG